MQRHVLWQVFFLICLSSPAGAQGTCQAGQLGQPCSEGGVAIQANNEPGLNLGAGNPVHVATGNKYQQEVDLPPLRQAPLEVIRHYNGLDPRRSVLGRGWSLGYDTRLFYMAGRWQIAQADGSRIMFDGTAKQAISNRHGSLHARAGQWVWTWPDGRTLSFDQAGRLAQIVYGPPGARHSLSIQRSAQEGALSGVITQITSTQGLALVFSYQVAHGHAYLQAIDTPAGRFRYDFEPLDPARPSGALRLKRVTRPDGMQRRYLYEAAYQADNAFALTGIEIATADGSKVQRLNTWAYDRSARAILSIRGGPQSLRDKIRLDYRKSPGATRDGLTVVTSGNGQSSHFHTALRAGRHVLLGVSGDGCPGCAAPGTRARYDVQGRLSHINGTALKRRPSGQIEQLGAPDSGWPGLQMTYQENGLRSSWASTMTGTEHSFYNQRNQPIRRAFSNGDRWDYRYDLAGRPAEIEHISAQETHTTTLHWQGKLLTRIDHPHERESRQYDKHGRLQKRHIERTANSAHQGQRYAKSKTDAAQNESQERQGLRYTESFHYDAHNRLTRHHLPEGGSLVYDWGPNRRLRGITWHDAQGTAHQVIGTTPGQPGYDYGNGLRLRVGAENGQAAELQVSGDAGALWTQRLDYDRHGRLQQESHKMVDAPDQVWRYAHDGEGRLIGAQQADAVTWYAWNRDGALAALRTKAGTIRPDVTRDASGLPTAADALVQGVALHYGPNRRLVSVTRDGQVLDRYWHNAFGQRIQAHTPQGQTDYLYLDNRVVAEARHAAGHDDNARVPPITRRYVYAHHVLVGLIDYAPPAAPTSAVPPPTPISSTPRASSDNPPPTGTLYAVHTDLIGAPRMVTDADRQIRWLATYSPTGAATRIEGDLTLDLRLPGQVYDATTGWHDNLLRTYLPEYGQYLELDPLGPQPGHQALGYAGQQPRRYVDPWGLLLFAFDGTRMDAGNESNVWKLSQRYQDGPVFYHAGPGNPHLINWDAVTAYNAPLILDAQWQSLLDELQSAEKNEATPIDIIGYSRGAALARHFGNQINRHTTNGLFSYTDERRGLVTACVDLRFMGLFDTVAQFGLAGSQNSHYDLSIAAAWDWVAHAVALHERRWLFPLASVGSSLNAIEAPFIGAHSDIGGGIAYDERGEATLQGDLSDVTLNWMLWQARAASLQFSVGDPSQGEVDNPVLHDQRSATARSVQNGDRRMDDANGALLHPYQDDHARLGRAQRDATEPLIQRYEGWRRQDRADVGLVDMTGYAYWLQSELGWQALPV